ncbi:hypothetical protein WMY93_022390 [Mugilogobius chulae]|uniref:Uncharacterized protein n=1 Tax=Mugilogobius chulae TaxID=88201 RepID=A0AAW0N9T9_9GOBI
MRVTTDGDRSHYRPPPILSPIRAGAGLHCSVAQTCVSTLDEFPGRDPALRGRRHAHSDSHNALLLWRPLKELEPSANEQRVEALLKLARSSAVPGGKQTPKKCSSSFAEQRRLPAHCGKAAVASQNFQQKTDSQKELLNNTQLPLILFFFILAKCCCLL